MDVLHHEFSESMFCVGQGVWVVCYTDVDEDTDLVRILKGEHVTRDAETYFKFIFQHN